MSRGLLYAMYTGLWTALAFLNAELARSKNDRPFKWFILSIWLGPLASMLILARPRLDRAPGEKRESRSLTSAWSRTGESIKE